MADVSEWLALWVILWVFLTPPDLSNCVGHASSSLAAHSSEILLFLESFTVRFPSWAGLLLKWGQADPTAEFICSHWGSCTCYLFPEGRTVILQMQPLHLSSTSHGIFPSMGQEIVLHVTQLPEHIAHTLSCSVTVFIKL